MNDKELLEFAAKAAGMELTYLPQRQGEWAYYRNEHGGETPWDPLADDGDALRLAVKLVLGIRFYIDGVGVGESYEMNNADPQAATRRAIVRAAAEIGRAITKPSQKRKKQNV